MPEFSPNAIINEPPDIIHKDFIKPDKLVNWMNDLYRFDVVKEKVDEVGSIAHLYYKQSGRPYIMEDKFQYC